MHRRWDHLARSLARPCAATRPPALPGHRRWNYTATLGPQAFAEPLSQSYVPSRSGRVAAADPTAKSARQDNPVDPAVFEEATEDYAAIIASSVPPPPTTLQLIEQQLPKLLPQPTTGDASIFEDGLDSAYDLAPSVSTSTPAVTEVLVQLIQQHDYDNAYKILHELQELHVKIPPSLTYAFAALHVLRNYLSPQVEGSALGRDDVYQRFTSWLSHIPFEREARHEDHSEIRQLLLSAPTTDIALIKRFAVIMASKGYAEKVISPFTNLIIRYSSPQVARQFIHDFEEANRTYWTGYRQRSVKYMGKRVTTLLRSAAVRTFVHSGRFKEAIDLLPASPGDATQLSPSTYEFLRRSLFRADARKYAEPIALLDTLLSSQGIHPQDDVDILKEFRNIDDVVVNENLADTLRYLKHKFHHRDTPPHPYTIVYFIEDYLASGRTVGLHILRDRASRSDPSFRSLFTFAEMLFYRLKGSHDLIIQTFIEEFYLSGVMKEEVLWEYDQSQKRRERGEPVPHRLFPRPSHLNILFQGKLWPTPAHCALIWHSLLELKRKDSSKSHLYINLLRFARESQHHRAQLPRSSDSDSSYLPVPPSWSVPVSPAAFTPFLRMMLQRGHKLAWKDQRRSGGGEGGLKVLRDMIKFGVRPSVYHYTELAAHFACRGDVESALAVLDGMEGGADGSAGVNEWSGNRIGDIVSASGMPEPDLITYISLLRAFVKSQRLDGAEIVRERMLSRFECELGIDHYLDEVLQDYEALKARIERQM
ncbi:hypothetical protein AX16_005955 [Volvariella volvacea WC 439]|nr:hypothetical protein AX16_005955 [Volvariella volvacea WC 439]